jgi:Protein of unknown function (DUF2971)
MRLYYMTDERTALLILRDRRLKLSRFGEMNDPFELIAANLQDKYQRQIARILKSHWAETMGAICTSDSWKSPVMWAHYANKHYGVCFGFDVPSEVDLIHKIRYTSERLMFELDRASDSGGVTAGVVLEMFLTKSKAWEYESEYRLTAELKEVDPTTGFYFVDFGPSLQLREVILGCRFEGSVGEMAKLIKNNSASVRVLRARPAHGSFAIVENLAVRPINVKAKS